MAKVLVVGGAGYVGSATTAWLVDHGHEVWVLDDLSTGFRELVLGQGFIEARAGDRQTLDRLLREHRFDCCMHFAAKALVAESVAEPELYRENNVEQTEELLHALIGAGVGAFIFSSTCAVFGDPGDRLISEELPKKPINPYGRTKLEVEGMLARLASERGLRSIALRYFNAAGAESALRVGELHTHETHLIPNVLKAALEGRPVTVLGVDYPTPDGTCVRDYVHVTDLAQAHEAAMLRLLARPAQAGFFEAFNLGTGQGSSVLEIIRAAESALGRPIAIERKARRPGDPPRLVADATAARRDLGFAVGEDSLARILSSALAWERKARTLRRAVFLDRDGTVNVDPGYLRHPDQMKLMPGVGAALARLQQAGYLLIVVSNQSGVGRGLIQAIDIPRINARLNELLEPLGARIDHAELCFHRPEEDCACRKPRPKLIVDAAQKLRVDLSRSYMVGDKISDLGAGKAAGCQASILVRTGEGRNAERGLKIGDADYVGDDLTQAAEWILKRG